VVDTLTPFTREPARAFTLWQAIGDAHLHLGELDEAVRCLDVAAALAPDEPSVSFLRGLALLEASRHKSAAAAFERVLERLPDDPETLLNRAVCRVELRDHTGAIADLDRLERSGAALPRLYFVRERARLLTGDGVTAARDRETGIGKEPTDAVGWVTRGRARLRQTPADTKGAFADFERAVAFDPNFRVGWENLAELLSERLGRPDDAVRALDRALAITPAHLANRAGRAVLHARAGRREAARADAEACLAGGDTDALILYQIACVYLLTADGRADRDRGIALLRACLRKDVVWAKLMPGDPDLKSIHGSPEFRALIDAATVLTR
jgi:tetratricopeptide (TPR) repeat protein